MRSSRFACPILALAFASLAASASPIRYTETVIGSGSLNGTVFTNQLVTLTGTADTTNIVNDLNVFYFVDLSNATVQIGGDPAVSLTGNIEAIDNPSFSVAGISEYGPLDALIVDTADPAFATYPLDMPITKTGFATFNPGLGFGVAGGSTFALTSVSGNSTLTAAIPTPEPSSILLLATGSLAAALMVRRKPRLA